MTDSETYVRRMHDYARTLKRLVNDGEVTPELLHDAIASIYADLGLSELNDPMFRELVVARIVEPVSKLEAIRVMRELGLEPPSYLARAWAILYSIMACRSGMDELPYEACRKISLTLIGLVRSLVA